jgi:hypothetical protein
VELEAQEPSMSDTPREKPNALSEHAANAETSALVRILELGEQQVREGKMVPAAEALRRFRDCLKRERQHMT